MHKSFYKISLAVQALILCMFLPSCFTGVEGTKRIDLGKADMKEVRLTAEEKFLSDVKGTPLKDWTEGKRFVVADSRFSFIAESASRPEQLPEMNGDTIIFRNVSSRIMPDGNRQAIINFVSADKSLVIAYPSGKEYDMALTGLSSDQLPMLIDLDMVDHADSLLAGRTLYPLSSLWYYQEGHRATGIKFKPVQVNSVLPGDARFPLIVTFTDADGKDFSVYMNYGNSGFESRSFASLFSLEDLKARYKSIPVEHWDLICRGQVTTGMTKEECRLALGNPTDVSAGHDYSRTLDLWHYSDGIYLRFADGLLVDFRK